MSDGVTIYWIVCIVSLTYILMKNYPADWEKQNFMNNRISKIIREKMGDSYNKRYYNIAKKKYKSLSKEARKEFLNLLGEFYNKES